MKIEKLEINGNYHIRDDGTLFRELKDGSMKVLTGATTQDGYQKCALVGGQQFFIHRLVAQTFIPNPDNLPHVDHIDEVKQNNNVTNLRWCTPKQNTSYYTDAPARKMLKEVNIKLIQAEDKINKLEAVEKVLLAKLDKQALTLNADIAKFEEYKKKELEKIVTLNSNYSGYKSVKGMKFDSKEELAKATGKAIAINNTLYPSAGAAAQYIIEQEATLGHTRTKATVSKELRRYLQGKRSKWEMYGRYTIGY